MNVNSFGTKMQQLIVMILVVILVVLVVFYGYIPDNYNYSVGSVSQNDIYATRTITDVYQTEYEALMAKNNVPMIFIRSDEIAENNKASVDKYFEIISEARSSFHSDGTLDDFSVGIGVENIYKNLKNEFNKDFDKETIKTFFTATNSTYDSVTISFSILCFK